MLLNIYIKEMKDSFRDRRTLLLTVFLPIIMMTGLVLFYEKLFSDGEGDSFTLAVSSSITAEEENIFVGFENIELVKSSNPEETVENGEAQAALLLTENFAEKIQKGEDASATIIGDSFSQNSSNLMNLVTSAFAVYEKTIISTRLQAEGTDPSVIQPFTIEQRELSGEDSSISLLAMLIPMMLALAIGIGAGPAAADLFAGEKEKKTMEALLMTPVKRSTLLISKWLTITSIGTITGMITLIVVALEITFLTENLKKAVTLGENPILIVGLAILISIVYAMFTASVLMLTSIIGKTVKEAQSYSSPVMMVAMFPAVITSTIGVNELSMNYFIIPILNLFSLLKELLFGIIDYQHIIIAIASNLVCVIVFFIISRILFLKDKWVMN
ncbi:ABC transporter permease [Robertmurraya andreesenii]|uniref:Sodium transport system permease protein n=1 Tax=Anoxybacillus andreesenii TaxID=1325932 RepID=A0ABT9V5L8_9BACL|nr:ABC transporter permease [Robertmurraya andreesenii]MDQ0156241.1 sodium transport system permease protein [Robertmurraya andreesenii]